MGFRLEKSVSRGSFVWYQPSYAKLNAPHFLAAHLFKYAARTKIRHVYVGVFLCIVMLSTMLADGKDISQNKGNGNTCRRKRNWHSLISIWNIKVNNLNLSVDIQSKFIMNPFSGAWENFDIHILGILKC